MSFAYQMGCAFALTVASVTGVSAQQAGDNASSLWGDFNHYVRVRRPKLAASYAKALMAKVNHEQLLQVVEQSGDIDYENTLALARQMADVDGVATKLEARIQAARIAQARKSVRVSANIEALAGTLRQRHNAVERLRGAGQFAAPQLLNVLRDQKQQKLHPHVETAMVAIGRPLVYPLSVALSQLEPVQMGQVAQILAGIEYPRALPYLKQVLEMSGVDPQAALAVQRAYDELAAKQEVPDDVTASELFLTLGENYYVAGTNGSQLPGYDTATDRGIVWDYDPRAGLISTPVPPAIFADVLAMRAAQRALALDRQMDPALSLWLGANLRRENRLGRNEVDNATHIEREPMYYARMAGPLRLHDVLDRAMTDQDTPLALDAIEALLATAGTDALLNRTGAAQPLLSALSYADRRIRFTAAFVLARARPKSDFSLSYRVVPVLAEAVRQSDLRHALVICDDQNRLNNLASQMKGLGYEAAATSTLEAAADVINTRAGFDLVVAAGTADQIESVYLQAGQNYKLATASIVAITSGVDQLRLQSKYRDQWRLTVLADGTDQNTLGQTIGRVTANSVGEPIGSDEAANFAARALTALRGIGLNGASLYNLSDAEPALIAALNDSRQPIVIAAGHVLELITSAESQISIADAALGHGADTDVRISLLNSLAESGKQMGNRLTRFQLDKLRQLVKTSDGDLALAAARAHGALTLPSEDTVNLVVD